MQNLIYLTPKYNTCMYSNKLLNKINFLNKISHTQVDLIEIYKAIEYIKKYHHNQWRYSGEPYYSHPIEVAVITTDYLFETEAIVTALLHDIIEDTKAYASQVELIFGQRVSEMVNALSKISSNLLLTKEETFYKMNQLQDPKKMAIIIKLLDRLHNIRTISYINSIEKQKRIAKETMLLYIPLAIACQLHEIAKELQKTVLEILNL